MIDDSREARFLGATYRLEFDLAAFHALEQETGISILGEGITDRHLNSVGPFLAILHAGLRAHHPDVTRGQLERMKPREVRALRPVLIDALRVVSEPASEAPPEEEGEGPPEAQRSPGASSGPSVASNSD